ncbi:hypothetical protein NIES4071_49450 [Calothrix sp. NIES-4071]|nr:hypothetical protein NIES4071_49450 [Calothrix sp. NIES-4071]BAZ59252.1 hypothetical protein NIES4105_49390 [Calothrix sp. NIES-4105]
MNNHPRLPTEFEQIIQDKIKNFRNFEFVFTAINEFLYRYKHGYFTIVGVPGSGKSAILAKYVTDNPDVIYYNAHVGGKNCAEEFLKSICNQIVETLHVTSLHSVPGNIDNLGSGFLSLLLLHISDNKEPNQRLIIVIDGLDAVDRNRQFSGTNLFYLPRYLPNGVYFIIARRPFTKDKSGLLIEAPSQILDLSKYKTENWDDVEAFTKHWRKMQGDGLSQIQIKMLGALTEAGKDGITVNEIVKNINNDEYDIFEIEEILENWFEFLQQHQIGRETYYSFYHHTFRDWLAYKLKNAK